MPRLLFLSRVASRFGAVRISAGLGRVGAVKGVTLLKFGGVAAFCGGVYAGVKGMIGDATRTAGDVIQDAVGFLGFDLSDSQANVILCVLIVAAVFGGILYWRSRRWDR